MACIKIPKDLAPTQKDRSDGLCPACQLIFDHNHFFSGHDDEGTCRLTKQDSIHFHSKTMYHSTKAACPGCRLILSFFSVSNGFNDESLKTDIRIRPRKFFRDSPRSDKQHFHFGSAMEVLVDRGYKYSKKAVGAVFIRGEKDILLQTKDPLRVDPLKFAQGRLVQSNIDLSLVKGWMQFCDANHKECRPASQRTHDAFRLIDLTHWKVINASPNHSYLALSYVWGRDMVSMLTKKTLPEFSVENGLQHVEIPRTIRNAMSFTRDIGHRYIWVDSFCIVQDDGNDKMHQLPIMHKIYSNADFVTVAASGASAHI